MDGEPIDGRERQFGLGTTPVKTCRKLRKLMRGHWRFFQALASTSLAARSAMAITVQWGFTPRLVGKTLASTT